jgi:hypothetical protein
MAESASGFRRIFLKWLLLVSWTVYSDRGGLRAVVRVYSASARFSSLRLSHFLLDRLTELVRKGGGHPPFEVVPERATTIYVTGWKVSVVLLKRFSCTTAAIRVQHRKYSTGKCFVISFPAAATAQHDDPGFG